MKQQEGKLPRGPLTVAEKDRGAHERDTSRGVWWGPLMGVGIVLMLFLVPEFIALPVSYLIFRQVTGQQEYAALNDWLSTSVGNFWFILLTDLALLATIGLIAYKKKSTLRGLGIIKLRLQHIWQSAAWFVAYIGIYLVIVMLVSALVPGFDASQERDIGFNTLDSRVLMAAVFFVLVVLTPIVEEIMFRGFLFGGFRKKMRFITAALLTSVMFGVAHLSSVGDSAPVWVAALDTFVLSMILCYAREKTTSLWPPIFIHGLKNAMAFTFLYLVQ